MKKIDTFLNNIRDPIKKTFLKTYHGKKNFGYYYHILNNLKLYLSIFDGNEFICPFLNRKVNKNNLYKLIDLNMFDRISFCPITNKRIVNNVFRVDTPKRIVYKTVLYGINSNIMKDVEGGLNLLIKIAKIKNNILVLNNFIIKNIDTIKNLDSQFKSKIKNIIGINPDRFIIDDNRLLYRDTKGGSGHAQYALFDFLTKEKIEILSTCVVCNKKYPHNVYYYSIVKNETSWVKKGSSLVCGGKCYKKAYRTPEIKNKYFPIKEESKKKQSETMLKMIKDGEFTPKTENYKTFKRLDLYNLNFRSSWELYYYHEYIKNYKSLEFEKLRVQYDIDGKNRNYIVDFIDNERKVVIEVKPKKYMKQKISIIKRDALLEWCNNNGYEYIWINDDWFKDNVNQKSLDEIDSLMNNSIISKRLKQYIRR